jgi:hypothetical protein
LTAAAICGRFGVSADPAGAQKADSVSAARPLWIMRIEEFP